MLWVVLHFIIYLNFSSLRLMWFIWLLAGFTSRSMICSTDIFYFFTSLVTGSWSLNNVYLGSSFSAIHVSLKTTDKEISASIFFFCVQEHIWLQLIQIMLEYYWSRASYHLSGYFFCACGYGDCRFSYMERIFFYNLVWPLYFMMTYRRS